MFLHMYISSQLLSIRTNLWAGMCRLIQRKPFLREHRHSVFILHCPFPRPNSFQPHPIRIPLTHSYVSIRVFHVSSRWTRPEQKRRFCPPLRWFPQCLRGPHQLSDNPRSDLHLLLYYFTVLVSKHRRPQFSGGFSLQRGVLVSYMRKYHDSIRSALLQYDVFMDWRAQLFHSWRSHFIKAESDVEVPFGVITAHS